MHPGVRVEHAGVQSRVHTLAGAACRKVELGGGLWFVWWG